MISTQSRAVQDRRVSRSPVPHPGLMRVSVVPFLSLLHPRQPLCPGRFRRLQPEANWFRGGGADLSRRFPRTSLLSRKAMAQARCVPLARRSPGGPRMAIRSSVFRQHRFAEGIGPNGSVAYPMGSETEFTERAARSGLRCWHFHASPVGHIIKKYQLKPE
jgi:hypothetical protein